MAFDIKRRPKAGKHPSQEVHVAALGWEHDRIVEPFLPHGDEPPTYKPHRLILVAPGVEGAIVPNVPGAKPFPELIQRTLEGVCPVEVVPVGRTTAAGDLVEFDAVVEGMAKVLARELYAGNRVFVNISGGSKLAAFAAGLASMAYVNNETGGFYYVQPSHYAKSDKEASKHGMGVGFKQVIEFPPLAVGAPTMPRVWALSYIGERAGGVSQVDLLRFLRRVPESGLDDFDISGIEAGETRLIGGNRDEDSRARMRLKRAFLDPLVEEGYIDLKKRGRNRIVTLTQKGRMYARLAPPTDTIGE